MLIKDDIETSRVQLHVGKGIVFQRIEFFLSESVLYNEFPIMVQKDDSHLMQTPVWLDSMTSANLITH